MVSRRRSRRPGPWPGLVVLATVAVCLAGPALGADLSALYATKNASVVTITSNGQPAGTGFFVADHLIATCHHVIKDAGKLGYAEQYRDGLHPVTKIAGLDPDHDLALLYADKEGPPLEVVLPYALAPGAELATIGSPMGFEKSIAQGNFNNLRDDGKVEYLQVSVPASHGSSGSPLFNAKGQVVGVMQRVIKPQYGQNLNFAISSKPLLALIEAARGKDPSRFQTLPERPARPADGEGGRNFGAFYAWIDRRGVYCFTGTPPPEQALGRMLTREEVLASPVSFMWPTGAGPKNAQVQKASAP